jgi:hypothetical protein
MLARLQTVLPQEVAWHLPYHHVDRRLATAQNRVDEVVTEVAVRAAVSTTGCGKSGRNGELYRFNLTRQSLPYPDMPYPGTQVLQVFSGSEFVR